MLLAFIADIHEDIKTLHVAFKKIQKLNCDILVCLGDITGFSVPYYKYLDERDAEACIELIKQHFHYVVVGNHDHFAIRKFPRHHPFPDLPQDWYNLCYTERRQINQNRIWLYEENELSALLSRTHIDWIDTLPEYQVIDIHSLKIFVSHFIYPDLTGISTEFYKLLFHPEQHQNFVEHHQACISFFAHIHPRKLIVLYKNGTLNEARKITLTPDILGIGIPPLTRESKPFFVTFNTKDFNIQIHEV